MAGITHRFQPVRFITRMKSRITVLFFIFYAWSVSGQSGSESGSDVVIGSATLMQKATNSSFDRWEIRFHDSRLQRQVMWLLAKSEINKPLKASSYRIRKRPFEDMGLKDMLCVLTLEGKDYPVKKGKIKLDLNGSGLNLDTKLKVPGYGLIRYRYNGKYKIIVAGTKS